MLKVGNGQSQGSEMNTIPQAPIDSPSMPQDDMMTGGEEMPMDNSMAPSDNTAPTIGGAQSEFDTNFDAGVEADEDTDPEKYIQQLTGKLSTTLNTFNNENGDSSGLNKYVAKMIVKAATKNMDDEEKKDIIKAINTSQNTKPDNDNEEETNEPDELESDGNFETQGGDETLQENIKTKKELSEMIRRRKNKK